MPGSGWPARNRSQLRVAGIVSVIIALVYVALVALLDYVAISRLEQRVDAQLVARVLQVTDEDASRPGPASGIGIYGAAVYTWHVGPGGRTLSSTSGAPALVPLSHSTLASWEGPRTVTIGGGPFRLAVAKSGSGWVLVGESVAELGHLEGVLVASEALALPVILAAVFLTSLAIGMRAVIPVEQARRRQLEFTADASHELRTPLSVIEAEVALARHAGAAAGAEGEGDGGTLARIAAESKRLTRIVEDLLWLARADAEPPPPHAEPIELGVIAEQCVDRFAAVAAEREVDLSYAPGGSEPVLVKAPPEWIDRLAGVLVDNACRYAGEGGKVAVSTGLAGGRAYIAVEDSGPGIPQAERERLFDRFHRSTDEPGGHGLGLAIADSVVRSTGGRWRIGDSAAGGARMEVSWPRTG